MYIILTNASDTKWKVKSQELVLKDCFPLPNS